MNILKKILNNESGQGMLEYSLIASLVALAVIGAVMIFADSVHELYKTITIME